MWHWAEKLKSTAPQLTAKQERRQRKLKAAATPARAKRLFIRRARECRSRSLLGIHGGVAPREYFYRWHKSDPQLEAKEGRCTGGVRCWAFQLDRDAPGRLKERGRLVHYSLGAGFFLSFLGFANSRAIRKWVRFGGFVLFFFGVEVIFRFVACWMWLVRCIERIFSSIFSQQLDVNNAGIVRGEMYMVISAEITISLFSNVQFQRYKLSVKTNFSIFMHASNACTVKMLISQSTISSEILFNSWTEFSLKNYVSGGTAGYNFAKKISTSW